MTNDIHVPITLGINTPSDNQHFNSTTFIRMFFFLTTLETFNLILIGWLIKFNVQTFQAITLEGVISIGGEHQFIGHCLIPLGP